MNPSIRIRTAGIFVKGDEVLLVRHEKGGRSYWLFPGGGVDYGETAGESLVREFREECGLDVRISRLVLVHDSIPPDGHRQVLNLYYLVDASDPRIQTGHDEVMKEARFHRLDELCGLVIYPKVTEQVLEGIRTDWKAGCRYLGNLWET